MHFEQMPADYASARPAYPESIYRALTDMGVIGAGIRVLEIGAGTGLATREVARVGSEVMALEPGPELARLLREAVPEAAVVVARLEDTELPESSFDSVIAATSMHWVDLSIGLPKLHATLRPDGLLAVWRNVFWDPRIETPFRRRVDQIVAQRTSGTATAPRAPDRPSMEELAAGGWFEPVHSERWRWSIDLSTNQLRRLFQTFSDWTSAEADAAAEAVDELGGHVTEHYQSLLHVLKRASSLPPVADAARTCRGRELAGLPMIEVPLAVGRGGTGRRMSRRLGPLPQHSLQDDVRQQRSPEGDDHSPRVSTVAPRQRQEHSALTGGRPAFC